MHACLITSVTSDSLQPHGPWPARLLCPWGSPGKNTGVGYHFLLHLIYGALKLSMTNCSDQIRSIAQSCPTLCDPINCSMPGLPVHHQLPEFTQTHVHQVSDAIQPSHPLSSPSPAPNPSQHQGLFQWIKWSSLFKSLLTSYRRCCLTGVETVWINRGKHNVDKVPLPHQEECQRRSCQQRVSSFSCIPATSTMQRVMGCSDSRLAQATVEEGIVT